jgi:hypothetical protein
MFDVRKGVSPTHCNISLHFRFSKLLTAPRDPIPNRPAIHPTVIVVSRRNRSATPTFAASPLESLNFPTLRLYPPTVKPPIPAQPCSTNLCLSLSMPLNDNGAGKPHNTPSPSLPTAVGGEGRGEEALILLDFISLSSASAGQWQNAPPDDLRLAIFGWSRNSVRKVDDCTAKNLPVPAANRPVTAPAWSMARFETDHIDQITQAPLPP